MDPLPHENVLTALGEVGAAFVGFSLVVGMLRARSETSGKATREFYSLRDVAELGLLVVGASFLPMAIHAFGLDPHTTWRLASAATILVGGLSFVLSFRRHQRFASELRAKRVFSLAILVLNLVGFSLLSANILAGGATSGARYVVAILLNLSIAGVVFVDTTFSGRHDGHAA